MKTNERNRVAYAAAAAIVILLGLCSRYFSNIVPEWIGSYAGDILWALMVFLLVGLLFRTWTTLNIGITAAVISFAIEASQLYHSPWIDSLRRTPLGALVLGFGFLWSDLICYTIGIIIGVIIEKLVINRAKI